MITYPSSHRYIVNYAPPAGPSLENKKDFIWGYSSYVAASDVTNTAVIIFDQGFPGNIQILNSTFSGNQSVRFANKKCMILNNTLTKAITFATLQSSFSNSNNVAVTYDTESLTTIISSAGVSVG